jgi:hypothetical protein
VAGDDRASHDRDVPAVSHDTSVVNGNHTAAVVEDAPITNEAIPVAETPAINGDLHATGRDAYDVIGHSPRVQGAAKDPVHTEVVVVGAGLSGISAIYRLHKLGPKILVFEADSNFGGVWHWNRYPDARVNSQTPFDQLNIPEVW